MKPAIRNLIIFGILSFTLYNCNPAKKAGPSPAEYGYNSRKMLLRDEALSQLSYVDIANPKNNWYTPVPAGRDIQLIGNGRVLIGTGSGYEEREIATGKKVKELTSYTGTVSARKLKNGNILLAGLNWQGKKGIVLAEINESGDIQRLINYPDFDYVRLIRETSSGTLLVAANNTVFEGDVTGKILWKVKVEGPEQPHVWQAVRVADGHVVVAGGFSKKMQIFSAGGTLEKTISGPPEVNPNFYSGFQILPNGNYVVTNWQGHGPGHGGQGIQLLEYKPDGSLAWSWKQDPEKYSSLQGVIVLDGLNINLMHTENAQGILAPVK